ncbi:MAG TPA: MATE family efflux transporter [Steroidobacteraceae bacterium]|nr:MATE family efflux transporter [Steroidobacteraceae bacterium]
MEGSAKTAVVRAPLPAQRFDRKGRARVDYRAIIVLSAPLILNSAVQTLLNLTDTWFLGRLSTDAVAAMGTIYWPIIAVIMLLSGVGLAVQTVVAQSFGAGDLPRAAQATWLGLWSSALVIPLFAAIAFGGSIMLRPFGLDPHLEQLAVQFWFPRLLCAPLGLALWALFGFFNGIGRPKVTVAVSSCVALANIALNPLFMFKLGLGMAGSAWATNVALLVGLIVALLVFHGARYREYQVRKVRKPVWTLLWQQFVLGFPMGLLYAADLIGASFFQIMVVQLGPADGAATQIVMMLTSAAYMPGVGVAIAGTTLVGQAIGAGDRHWAFRVGNGAILLAAGYMGAIGLVLAAFGPWILPLFVLAGDPLAPQVIALGGTILWIAAGFQLFDGLNLGSGFALRGAGETAVPAGLVIVLSWFIFVPLAHTLIFDHAQAWIGGLPQLGWGSIGGWLALLVYVLLLGSTLYLRWRSRVWQKISLSG